MTSEQSEAPNVNGVLPLIDESYEKILDSVRKSYDLDTETASHIYEHLWIYTHGIASLCATGMCSFTGEQISTMMSEIFAGLLKNLKRPEK